MRTRWISLMAFSVLATAPVATAQAAVQDDEIATLRQLIGDIESQRQMVLAPDGAGNTWGSLVVVDRDRAGAIAGWLVLVGRLHPDSVSSWTREQLAVSRGALSIMKRQLSELEAQRGGAAPPPTTPPTTAPPLPPETPVASTPAPPPRPGTIRFPDPMDWRLVQGGYRGTYLIPCAGAGQPPVQGDFTLALVGDGTVRAEFEFNAEMIPTRGTIRTEGARGIAQGSGRTPDDVAWVGYDTDTVPGGEYRWAIRLGRWNDTIVLEAGSTVELVQLLPDYQKNCDPGTLRPLD
ncbi:MAG: hypothetical protein ABR559_04765 [Gemmatimonadota bacterium]